MSRKRFSPEQIINRLREAGVLIGKDSTLRTDGWGAVTVWPGGNTLIIR